MSAKPNGTAARFAKLLPNARAAASTGGYNETLNYAEALVNAASCSTCAFYLLGECRAHAPRLVIANSKREAAYPPANSDGWCGSWVSA